MPVKPMDIEKKSMEIIESELTVELDPVEKPIVKRVIHATADFSFAESLHFSAGVVPLMRRMLKSGATVVTDTNMALAGISKPSLSRVGARAICLMAEESVAAEAARRGITRAQVSCERALALPGPKLMVCGNAPTFLYPLLERKEEEELAVIGVPVGFVNVVEAKQRLWESDIPCITALGRRGGSNVAAAIVNALLYGIEGARA
ncbi:MAG: precorrin-8X methylmutase [Clostridiales bacterium]|nr:precorrin-8X methylmutase [Clostridiales bacterium]MDY5515464.1 precorrin-8X methylmutase [Candidatus Ventricola sp.]